MSATTLFSVPPCVILSAALLAAGCNTPLAQTPTPTIRIAGGDPEGVYFLLGKALARAYNDASLRVHAVTVPSGGVFASLDEVESRTADLSFATADAVYTAYTQGSSAVARPHTRIRAITMLYPNALQLVVRHDSRMAELGDLARARVGLAIAPGVHPDIANRSRMIGVLLSAAGHNSNDVHVTRGSFSDISQALAAGDVDVGWVLAGYPVGRLTALANDSGIRLLSIDRRTAAKVRLDAPFYKPMMIPAGTYPGQATSVSTIGVENLLVCRDDLDEQLVYRLTKGFFAALPALGTVHPAARQVNPTLASATPIPLHRGAARYYRERELFR